MSGNDRDLGMNRSIGRRDFVNGVAVAVGASLLPKWSWALELDAIAAQQPGDPPAGYPPRLTGMRGSHAGSFEVAHQLRDRRSVDLSSVTHTGETYDLVVVGGGMSGLAAAYYFVARVGRSARVLVLDNHDDFGGHAKRNEFVVDGRLLALNGGTLNIESPLRYNLPSRQLLEGIGVDLDRFVKSNESNRSLYSSLGLRSGHFFDKETWGEDRLVVRPPGSAGGRGRYTREYLEAMPLSTKARQDMLRLQDPNQPDYMPGLSSADKKERLARISLEDYLLNIAKVDKQCLWFFITTGRGNFCVGADAIPALFGWEMGVPGFAGLKLEPTPDGVLADLPGGHHGRQKAAGGGGSIHFPDGNATLARLLVRWLIPAAVPGHTQQDVGAARVDYARLDEERQTARIRLSSTVVNVRHDGPPESATEVVVTYSKDGKLFDVRGHACVMACWNMFVPYLTPELPAKQKDALLYGVKGPLVYTSVALRRWTAFETLGVSNVATPTMYHDSMGLSEAVDLGELRHPRTPNEPVVIRLDRHPCAPGKPRKEQHRIGRADLLATSFETFERNIRDQLARVLAKGGFDPARDIAAITVNRWPHGYAYTYNSLTDPMEWVFTSTNERPCVIGRQPFGLISIANSDAAASPHTDAAFLEANRAVGEVLERRAYPFLTKPRARSRIAPMSGEARGTPARPAGR
jgi:spermidine dehydrogenase